MYLTFSIQLNTPLDENESIVSAFLGQYGFETFTQSNLVESFIAEDAFNEEVTINLLDQFIEMGLINSYSDFRDVPKVNWNEEWEKNFEPVLVPGICHIRASFHTPLNDSNLREILITPKMSFGTGHHSTTRLMIQAMHNMNLSQAHCLDMGTGTGILGIYAVMEGAKYVLAIDNDEWCIENCFENLMANGITPQQMNVSLSANVPLDDHQYYDLVIANINRNVLLEQIPDYAKILKNKGSLLLSGFHLQDIEVLKQKVTQYHLKWVDQTEESGWYCLQFQKA